MTETVSWSTVASWPVVRADRMDMLSGLGLVSAAVTARAQEAAAPDITHFQCRQDAARGGPRRALQRRALLRGLAAAQKRQFGG